jgi:hypothetical protein
MTILSGEQVRNHNPFKLTYEQEKKAVRSLALATRHELISEQVREDGEADADSEEYHLSN